VPQSPATPLLPAGALHLLQGGGTALYVAALNGHMDVARLLIEAGADLNAKAEARNQRDPSTRPPAEAQKPVA
jgi:ankyrin repeat protein